MLTSSAAPVVSSNTKIATGTNTASTTSTIDEAQDRFLKLLVAQLNNQDPMNPMDNAQMTSQMAQINTVTGIQQVNETLKSLGAQFTAMQVLQGSSMVGHDVRRRTHGTRRKRQGRSAVTGRTGGGHLQPGRTGCRPPQF